MSPAEGLVIYNTTSKCLQWYNGQGWYDGCTGATYGIIGSLDCIGTSIMGTLISNIELSGVSTSVPYTEGNGRFHNGQIVTSTGVTGLTAILPAGTFAIGSGSIIYMITGTPANSGIASFALSIGGQICTLNITISALTVPNSCNPSNPTAVVNVTNPITGRIWMDRNLGANRAATSSFDVESYGLLFQWGRGTDNHQCVNRYSGDGVTTSVNSVLNATVNVDNPSHGEFIIMNIVNHDWRSPQNNNLWQGVSSINNPCPSGYRLPTDSELDAERASWSTQNADGAFASPLKLPAAGIRSYNTGLISSVGTEGYYWSSTVSGTGARRLTFGSASAGLATTVRTAGRSVRCIKD